MKNSRSNLPYSSQQFIFSLFSSSNSHSKYVLIRDYFTFFPTKSVPHFPFKESWLFHFLELHYYFLSFFLRIVFYSIFELLHITVQWSVAFSNPSASLQQILLVTSLLPVFYLIFHNLLLHSSSFPRSLPNSFLTRSALQGLHMGSQLTQGQQ